MRKIAHSSLLETNDGERQIWQASLERPGSREHLGFTSLLKLYDFLDAQTGRTEEDDGPPG